MTSTNPFGVSKAITMPKLPGMASLKPVKPMKPAGTGGTLASMGAGMKTGFKAKGNDFTPMKGLADNKSFMTGARIGNQAQKPGVQAAAGVTAAAGVGATANSQRKPKQPQPFGKAASEPMTGERKLGAAVFGVRHSAVTAKKGRKVKATARTAGYNVVGGLGGGAVGAAPGLLMRSPTGATIGGGAGAAVGGGVGNLKAANVNNKKGHYKPEYFEKSDTSAFGVSHG